MQYCNTTIVYRSDKRETGTRTGIMKVNLEIGLGLYAKVILNLTPNMPAGFKIIHGYVDILQC